MTKSSWPVQFVRTVDGVDISAMMSPGSSPPFLVVSPVGTAGRLASSQIPAVAEFCSHFLRGRTCLEFEWRGIGLSGAPTCRPTIGDYSLDIAAVAGIIDEPFHVLAFGTACVPTMWLLANDDLPVLSLTLDSPSHRPPPWFRTGMSEDEYRQALELSVRSAYDFPAGVVAREVIPSLLDDAPLEACEAWMDAVCGSHDRFWASPVPTLIFTDEEGRHEASPIAGMLARARLVVERSHPWNSTRADLLRDSFDDFWAGVRPTAEVTTTALSPREIDVLRLLASGNSNGQIADALTLSPTTVATHVRHILKKTGCANRTAAAVWAREHRVT